MDEQPLVREAMADGGLTAWLQVVSSFLLFFNSWGIVNTFGVFQSYYQAGNLLKSTPSPAAISLIGSSQPFLLLIVCFLAGPLNDKGYTRWLIATGAILVVTGFMIMSVCRNYWQMILSQGICIGLGAGLLASPALSVITRCFSTRRAVATSIVTSGGAFGGVVFPLLFQELESSVGFAWATRAMGFVALGTVTIPLALTRPAIRESETEKQPLVDAQAFRDWTYLFYCNVNFFSFIGLFGPLFYLQSYALQSSQPSHTSPLANYLVAIMNAASIPGHFLPALLCHRLGPVNTMAVTALPCAIVIFSWAAVHDATSEAIFAAVYGLISGALVATPSLVRATLADDLTGLSTRMGMASVAGSLGALCGTPLAGAVLAIMGSATNYTGLQMFCGLSMAVSAVLLLILRMRESGLHFRRRV